MISRHSIASTAPAALAGLLFGILASASAGATEVIVVGLFPNKAVVQIDGGAPRTLSVGQRTGEGVVLVSVERDAATFDIQGRQARLRMGQAHATRSASSAASVVLNAGPGGHFVTDAQVNGHSIRFLVDTGATLISISAADAQRLALDYRKGQVTMTMTANGPAPAYRVSLDSVRVGDVTVNGVEAVVMEGGPMPIALLGMSFLNRMNMKREGQTMTLTKRF